MKIIAVLLVAGFVFVTAGLSPIPDYIAQEQICKAGYGCKLITLAKSRYESAETWQHGYDQGRASK